MICVFFPFFTQPTLVYFIASWIRGSGKHLVLDPDEDEGVETINYVSQQVFPSGTSGCVNNRHDEVPKSSMKK